MADTNQRLNEGLQKAIQAEIDGHHFYMMASKSTADEKGREIFEILATEELEHVRFLKAQRASVLEKGKPDADEKLGPRADLSGSSPIFSSQLAARVQEAHFEMSALSIGIQLELNAVKFYKGEADAATDPAVKKFYTELASWESGHYHILLRQHDELKDEYWDRGGFSPF